MRIIVLNLHYKQKTPKHIKAMALELVYLSALSGEKCSFYAVLVDHCAQTEFENFIQEHQAQFYSEVKEIIQRLHQMGKTTGALHPFSKRKEIASMFNDMATRFARCTTKNESSSGSIA